MKENPKPIKSFIQPDPRAKLDVGDSVFVGDMTRRDFVGAGCPMCAEPTEEELKGGVLTSFKFEDMCEDHQLADLVLSISSIKALRIEKWRSPKGGWRVGIEWYSDTEYEYICEAPTLLEALLIVKDFLDQTYG